MGQENRIAICDGVEAIHIQDKKYKSNFISVNFLVPLEEKTAAANALALQLLRRSCKEYPDFTSFNCRLSELYGATVGGWVKKIGDVQALTLCIYSIRDEYALTGEKISEECAKLLLSMIFSPVLENGVFRTEDFEQEKRQLLEEIQAEFNDKRVYAKKRCDSIMFEKEAFRLSPLGEKKDVEALTAEAAARAWNSLLQSAKIEVMLLGDMEADAVIRQFASSFQKVRKSAPPACRTMVREPVGQVKEVVERFDVSQAKLVMGFRTKIAEPSEKVMAMRLTSAVLGGTPHSKLFLNVREKLSLCSYCSSQYERNKGVLYVSSGVEEKNKEAAQREILNQIDEIRRGHFDEEELQAAKLSMQDSFRTTSDSLVYLGDWYLRQIFDHEVLSPEQAAAAVEKIGREEIIACAESLVLDTVYLLAGQEEEKKR